MSAVTISARNSNVREASTEGAVSGGRHPFSNLTGRKFSRLRQHSDNAVRRGKVGVHWRHQKHQDKLGDLQLSVVVLSLLPRCEWPRFGSNVSQDSPILGIVLDHVQKPRVFERQLKRSGLYADSDQPVICRCLVERPLMNARRHEGLVSKPPN